MNPACACVAPVFFSSTPHPLSLCMCVCARADNGNYIVDLAFKTPIKDVR
jgi:hypothetical protein